MANLSAQLLQDLIAIVGPDAVLTNASSRDLFSRTTLPKGTRPAAIVRPATREQVQKVFQKASAARCPVYPISRGKNWGYGDACAPQEDNLIMDLSRMNRIVEVNAELAYAVIEPGVTQGQLAEYLEKNNIPLILDGNGAGPDASLIGNIVERGFGHSRYGDRFAHACNFEAVLADGRILSTGFGSFPQARAQHVYNWGIGPFWDGLFTQSNLAVITRVTVWLMPKPEHVNYVFIGLKDPDAIGTLVDRFRPLYLAGTLRSVIHCANDLRLLGSATHFPWREADGRTSLDIANPALLQTLYKEFGVRAWSMAGILTGSRHEVAASRKKVKRTLRAMPGLDTLFFMGPRVHRSLQKVNVLLKRFQVLPRLQRDLEKVDWLITLFEGRPSPKTLQGAHWRARGQAGDRADPLDSQAGLIWINCVLPMTSESVLKVNRLSQSVFQRFGFEFQTTLSFVGERAICAIMSICFDHQSTTETSRALECEEALLEALLQEGYLPYRASVRQQKQIASQFPFWNIAHADVKKALDPQGLIAPGRYEN